MSIRELYPITIEQYLQLCGFINDFTIPDINKKYLIQPYSNGTTSDGFKLIHKLLFYPHLLKEYLEYLTLQFEGSNKLDSHQLDSHPLDSHPLETFLLKSCDKVSLIMLCITFKLDTSFKLLVGVSTKLFLNGIYDSRYIFRYNRSKYICEKLNVKNTYYRGESEYKPVYLDDPILYEYLKLHPHNNFNTTGETRLNLKEIFNTTDKLYLDDDFINILGKRDKKYTSMYNHTINLKFIDNHLDEYKIYKNAKIANDEYEISRNKVMSDLVVETIIANYKNIDCNKVEDSDVLKIIIQCYKYS